MPATGLVVGFACGPVLDCRAETYYLDADQGDDATDRRSNAPLRIVYHTDGREVQLASGKVPALDPFEKTAVELTCGNIFQPGVS